MTFWPWVSRSKATPSSSSSPPLRSAASLDFRWCHERDMHQLLNYESWWIVKAQRFVPAYVNLRRLGPMTTTDHYDLLVLFGLGDCEIWDLRLYFSYSQNMSHWNTMPTLQASVSEFLVLPLTRWCLFLPACCRCSRLDHTILAIWPTYEVFLQTSGLTLAL